MSIYIKINKYFYNNEIHYYSVIYNFDKIEYFIGLDNKNKYILFFNDCNFSHPADIYDIQQDKYLLKDTEIYPKINGRVLLKAYKALTNNEFPDDISWFST